MRRRWSCLVLLASGLLLLASLYLPWQKSAELDEYFGPQSDAVRGFLDVFFPERPFDAWFSAVAPATALLALLVTGVAGVAFLRPSLAKRLPLGFCALCAAYFGFAVAVDIKQQRQLGFPGDAHYAYGAYIGIAAVIVGVLAAGAARRGELMRLRSASQPAALALIVGLLVAFLLPWQRYSWPSGHVTALGIASPAAVVAAAFALALAAAWWKDGPAARRVRLGLSVAVALFTVGAFGDVAFAGTRAYGAWIGLGIALALVALSSAGGVQASSLGRLPWRVLATAAAALLFVTALFLPWLDDCFEGSAFGPLAGRCVSMSGWTTIVGSAAAVLALALGVSALAARRRALSVIELSTGFALVVVTLAFQLGYDSGPEIHIDHAYGMTIGLACAALLVVLALAGLRRPALEWNRVPARLVPIAACAGYVAVVVVPWWDVLPTDAQSGLGFAPLSWLTITGALLGVHLLGLWLRPITGDPSSSDGLVLVPIALLALAAVDLARLREEGMTWGGWLVLGLCSLLALLGSIEQRGGIRNVEIPELLRIDRL